MFTLMQSEHRLNPVLRTDSWRTMFGHWSLLLLTLLTLTLATTASAATEEAKLLAADGDIGDSFGISVAVDGDTAVIGASQDADNGTNSGSAYVFTRSGAVWTQQTKLTASDGAMSALFGASVAIDGDTIVIGAFQDFNGVASGSAYVFTRSGATWTEQAKLTPSDAAVDDKFGFSVAVDSDTAVIGSYKDDDNGTDSGSAYVFTRSGAVWTQQDKLSASDGAADDWFGYNVAVDGDTAVIGSRFDDDNGIDSGSAYIFTRSGTAWTQQDKLLASDTAANDQFATSVAVDGNTAVIGAFRDDDNGTDSGSAYVFTRSSGVWTQQAKLSASDGAADDYFGFSVAVDSDTVIVGAYRNSDNGLQIGSAYSFTRSGTVWTEQDKLTASDAANAANDFFGRRVAVSGDTAIIGSSGGISSGAAYAFDLNTRPFTTKDFYTMATDTTLSVAAPGILANDGDIDGDAISASLLTGPASGTLMLNSDGSFTFTPAPGFTGRVTFTYQASDALPSPDTNIVTIDVSTPPIAIDDGYNTPQDTPLLVAAPGVLQNDSDPDSDLLTVSLVTDVANGSLLLRPNGKFRYTPNTDYVGVDTFVYAVTDGVFTQQAMVTINVQPVGFVWETSSNTSGTIGGVSYGPEDVIQYDASSATWSMIFDGSAHGISADVDAFTRANDTKWLLSFATPITLPGITGTVDDSDIVLFLPATGTFTMFLDGSDVGLDTDGEAINAISFDKKRLYISIVASGSGEDVLRFDATSYGETTAGSFTLLFDGSAAPTPVTMSVGGLSVNACLGQATVGAIWLDGYTGNSGAFGVNGDGSVNTLPAWSGEAGYLAANVDALAIGSASCTVRRPLERTQLAIWMVGMGIEADFFAADRLTR